MVGVKLLLEVTKELYQLVQQLPTQKERGETIEKITNLLEKRDNLISKLKAPYNDEEIKIGKEIVKMNGFIDSQFVQIKQLIQQDIRVLKSKKQSQKKYINPYNSMATVDGIYYDKRK